MMSVLISEGLVRSGVREGVRRGADPRPVHSGVGVLHPRVRAGETRRPPTRARVVAGRRSSTPATCASREVPIRWPWLAGLAVAACLIITGLGLFAGGMAAAEVPAETATVSVVPGETLSDLAIRFAPGSDTGAVVERIKLLNGLHDAAIAPGTPLTVPVRSGLASSGS
jgi:hypothetical protein